VTPGPRSGGRAGATRAPRRSRDEDRDPAEPRPALAFVTLGCPKNTVDSEHMIGLLAQAGFRTVADPAQADVAVVNTCGFLQSAARESRAVIGRLAAGRVKGRPRRLIVAGCLAQRAAGELLEEFPGVDAVLGTGRWAEVRRVAEALLAGTPGRPVLVDSPGGALSPVGPRALSTPRHLAYLKISEGCDRSCAFCVIPRLRGPQRSRPIAELVAEAGHLAEHGVRELVLIGQDTTAYGSDLPDGPALADLLEALDEIEGITWIRVMYAYPGGWSDRLIEVWARARRVVPYVDLPLQHISAGVLRAMARGGSGAATRALVRRIKSGVPGVALRTTFIVGFPGETEEQFAELCRYVEEEPFEHLVVFPYEREPGTAAWDLVPRVPLTVRRVRRARLLALQQRLARVRNARRVGERLAVMIDGAAGPNQYAARDAGSAFEVDGGVVVEGDGLAPGSLVDVRVTGAAAYDLFARAEASGPHLQLVKGSF
jgi:ribosomal protein S12 methylthiotransferase